MKLAIAAAIGFVAGMVFVGILYAEREVDEALDGDWIGDELHWWDPELLTISRIEVIQ